MRYIAKGEEPKSLKAIKRLQNTKLKLSFDKLPTSVLVDIVNQLLYEQGYLCCFTMLEITFDTAEIVHFYPKKSFPEEELNYSNIFLALRQAKDLPEDQRLGQLSKGEVLIPKYIADRRCATLFRYNTLGEIVPAGTYRTVRKCRDNFKKLSHEQKMLFNTIEALNLNANRLKDQRKAVLYQVASLFKKATEAQKIEAIKKFSRRDKNGKYKRFCELIIQQLMT